MAIIGGGMDVEAKQNVIWMKVYARKVESMEGELYNGNLMLKGRLNMLSVKITDSVGFLFAWQMMLPYFYLMLICHVIVGHMTIAMLKWWMF